MKKIIFGLYSILFIYSSLWPQYNNEQLYQATHYFGLQDTQINALEELIDVHDENESTKILISHTHVPLFLAFPHLKGVISYISLADLPTPITSVPQLATHFDIQSLYIKRDDLTGGYDQNRRKLFGGNKVRKAEFLLADALAQGAQCILTRGAAGTNHGLAIATYAQQLGLRCILLLSNQHNTQITRRNLLLDHASGAQLVTVPHKDLRASMVSHILGQEKINSGMFPYIIPTGGSCPRGVLGYINAVFELKEQIIQGKLVEPDIIFAPVGSAGTIVGILLGVSAAGLKTRIVGIAVEPEEYPGQCIATIETLYNQTQNWLYSLDASFKSKSFESCDLIVRFDSAGQEYSLFTQQAVNAIRLVTHATNITLDGVYSAKAWAGMESYLQQYRQPQARVLFWNTFCSDSFESITNLVDYHQLPLSLQIYFEQPVQPLDQQ